MSLREKDKLRDAEDRPRHNPQKWRQVKKVNYPTHEEASLTLSAMTFHDAKKAKIRKRRIRGEITFDVVVYELLPQQQ